MLQAQLDEVYEHLRTSRVKAHEAKTFLDVGYPTRLMRDEALAELVDSVEKLTDIVERLSQEADNSLERRIRRLLHL
jgi:hypothetical protein